MAFLAEYNIDSSKTKSWVTGYSITGAVSNMVAKRLIDMYNNNGDKVLRTVTLRHAVLETAAKIRCELRFYAVYKQWQSSDITVYITIQIRKDENKIIGKMSYTTEQKGYYPSLHIIEDAY